MKQMIALVTVFFCCLQKNDAQIETNPEVFVLPKIIESDTSFAGRIHVLSSVYIAKEVNLNIEEGSELIFFADSRIIADGNIFIEGSAKKRVRVRSDNPLAPGSGIVIKGTNEGEVKLVETIFENLQRPLIFQTNWSRRKVSILDCQFVKNDVSGAVIDMRPKNKLISSKGHKVVLMGNLFTHNSGPVFLSEIGEDSTRYEIVNNVFTQNYFRGESIGNFFSSPLLFNYYATSPTDNYWLTFSNNAIFDNYTASYVNGELRSETVSWLPLGHAPMIPVDRNFFGSPDKRELERTYSKFSEHYPLAYTVNRFAEEYDSTLNPTHLISVNINGRRVQGDVQHALVDSMRDVTLFFSKEVHPQSDFSIKRFVYLNDTIWTDSVNYEFRSNTSPNQLSLIITELTNFSEPPSYYSISGIKGEDGTLLPPVLMGKKTFVEKSQLDYSVTDRYPGVAIVNETSGSQFEKLWHKKYKDQSDNLNAPKKLFRSSDWYAESFLGFPTYFGDLYASLPTIDLKNTHLVAGIGLKYRHSSSWAFSMSAQFLRISGTDNRVNLDGSLRGTGYKRNLSFRTFIAELNALVEYNGLPQWAHWSWVPGVHSGIKALYFNPQGFYNGEWYNLRDIGTEGQTIHGKDDRYSRVVPGIPVGLHVSKVINKRAGVRLYYTHTKLFTDYLDDLSTGFYPEEKALREANPEIPAAAVALSNPSGLSGQRSSSEKKDAYSYLGISFYYHLVR